jgi:small subunit ribosomal protein S16
MVRIRLTRMGRKKLPFYRIVAADAKTRRDGKPISYLGTYDPITKNSVLKNDEIKLFLSKGAQPSDTVKALLIKEGLL